MKQAEILGISGNARQLANGRRREKPPRSQPVFFRMAGEYDVLAKRLATAVATIVVAGNVSFPLAVMLGVVG